jgi:hypothetical protein
MGATATATLGLGAAAMLAGAAAAQVAAKVTPEDRWVVSVTAYGWAPSVEGHTRVGGQKADVDMPFSDLLKDFAFGAMGMVAARRGRFGFYLNPFFARTISDEGGGGIEARIESDSSMVGLGGLYRLLDWQAEPDSSGPRGAQLEALAGVRVTYMRTEINFRHGLPKLDDDKTWADPIVGLGGRLQLTDRWETFAEGDIGGFGVGSDLTWSWTAGVGYGFELFGRQSFVRAGYRMLYQDYKDGGFEWDVTYKGPVVGLTTRF